MIRCGQDICYDYDDYCCEDGCCHTVWSFWWFWIIWISLFMCFGACCWACRQRYNRRCPPPQQYIIIPQPNSRYGSAIYGTISTSTPPPPPGFFSSAPPRPPAYTAEKPPAYATGGPPQN
ncbi:hypothetical protein LSAT2_000864 [Lamellibrachia satsuma]|nr:hypothetical protein LSAT2_000864 [Lamellibrachia satsuma]